MKYLICVFIMRSTAIQSFNIPHSMRYTRVMRFKNTTLVTCGYIGILLLLGGVDGLVMGRHIVLPSYVQGQVQQNVPAGVAPKKDPDVLAVLSDANITTDQPHEQSFLDRIAPKGTAVTTWVLLQNGDRIGLLSYIDSPAAKDYFNALKKVLFASL